MRKKMQYLVPLGIMLLFAGMIFIILGTSNQMKTEKTGTTAKVAVGGFIGPIPFGFANDRRMMYFVLAMMVVLIGLYIFMARRLY